MTTTTAIPVHIEYFAILREQRGVAKETRDTAAATPKALYAMLQKEHNFTLSAEQLQVAINDQFSDWQTPLNAGDTVVFLPPVAGG